MEWLFYLILCLHMIRILMNWTFFLKHWEGPSFDLTYRNYVWTLLAHLLHGAGVLHGWCFICFDLTFYTCIILIPSFISVYRMTLHCIYCTFQSRILTCWLMLSVSKTTINKSYLILSCLILSYLILSYLILTICGTARSTQLRKKTINAQYYWPIQ